MSWLNSIASVPPVLLFLSLMDFPCFYHNKDLMIVIDLSLHVNSILSIISFMLSLHDEQNKYDLNQNS